jgi:hypothetical protein
MSMPVMPLRDVILIHVLPPVISAVAIIIVGMLAARKQLAKTQELHVTFNDRMDKALISERASGVAEGRLAERNEREDG